MADEKFVKEYWEPAQPLLDEIIPVLNKYSTGIQMTGLFLQLLSYELNGKRVDVELLCKALRDVAAARDESHHD